MAFALRPGEALGIVGESGSGKSVTALSILRLFGPLAEARVSGEVRFEGRDLLQLSEAELRRVRGARIGMVFQDPLTSLNPSLPVGEQVIEAARHHRGLSAAEGRQRGAELLELVGIPDPRDRLDHLPYSFSGGMRQRIMIALAIACEPKLLIADEPTTALDVTVQAQVLLLLDRLRRELGMALIMISHDIGVVAATCDRVLVLYGGQAVETGTVRQILDGARHPYTRALLRSIPRLGDSSDQRLQAIPGQPLTVIGGFRGCRFAPRCEFVIDRCRDEAPPLDMLGPDHASACWRARELPETVGPDLAGVR
ncbi:MAG: ABC transporter ATP-binding protein [Sporichthyaceae bacterium]|nr:ABC transporter ATP-binding protein [Sporichthyaceae bacterium]